jgi:5-methylcytosine-specific restriction endonuclease McrA
MSKHVIDQSYQKYLNERASKIGEYATLQEDYSGKARKDYQKRKDAEKAAQKRIRDAEKAAQKLIRDAEKAEQKRIRDAEKAAQKAEQKRIRDAEKAAQKAEQKRIKDAEKAAQKAEQKKDGTLRCKRNVKESMKKQVASEQNWRCKICAMQLPGNYEIDHIKPIKNGGVNDRVNLQALCRNCHGEKTQRETSGIKEQKKLTMKQTFERQGYKFADSVNNRFRNATYEKAVYSNKYGSINYL